MWYSIIYTQELPLNTWNSWKIPMLSSFPTRILPEVLKLSCHFLFQSEFIGNSGALSNTSKIQTVNQSCYWNSSRIPVRKLESLRTPIGKIDDLSPTDRECSLKNAEVVPKHICNGKQNCWVYHNLFPRDPCPEQVKYAVVHYKCEWRQYFWRNIRY